jgi:hypothetical protein
MTMTLGISGWSQATEKILYTFTNSVAKNRASPVCPRI